MSCEERRDRIFLHVAGVLEDDERAELEAHLATGCARCNEALEEERERLATLALALPPVVPPAHVREQLLARVREQAFRGNGNGARPPPRVRALRAAWRRPAQLAAAALGGAVIASALTWWRLAERPAAEPLVAEAAAPEAAAAGAAEQELASLRDQLDEQDEELAELEDRAGTASDIAKLMAARELDVLELAATDGSDAFGRAFWDPDYHCYFRARGLPEPADGQHYVLWMIGANERLHPAGTLALDDVGDWVIFTRLPRELSPISKSFVTAEADPSAEQPAGPTVLSGEAPS